MKHSAVVLLSALLCAGNSLAADPPATKPGATTTKASKPSSRGPGTQTEDELYIGAKPKTATAAKTQKRKGATPDEDLDDLEVERNRIRRR
jgi:hypothetical protein